MNPAVRIVGAQPSGGQRAFPGIRKWPEAYLPKIYDPTGMSTNWCWSSQTDAEDMARRLAREEGLFARHLGRRGLLRGAVDRAHGASDATIVFVVCDRGDRYLSTGVFPA